MNTKIKLTAFFILLLESVMAEKVPLEVKKEFLDLTNYWGKGATAYVFEEQKKKCRNELAGYDDREAVEGEWTEIFLRYIMNNTSIDPIWLSLGSEEMLFASYSGVTCTSTNCWFIAAEYAKKLTAIEKKAQLEYDQLSTSETFNMSETDRNIRATAWKHLVEAKYALGQTMRVVTNSYPQWILHKLPGKEGAALYTNVLRRAGLVQ